MTLVSRAHDSEVFAEHRALGIVAEGNASRSSRSHEALFLRGIYSNDKEVNVGWCMFTLNPLFSGPSALRTLREWFKVWVSGHYSSREERPTREKPRKGFQQIFLLLVPCAQTQASN